MAVTLILALLFMPDELAPAVNEGIDPLPLTPKPILVLLLVHAYVPAGLLLNAGTLTELPGQAYTSDNEFKTGIGLMVIVYVKLLPVQPFKLGVAEMVPE